MTQPGQQLPGPYQPQNPNQQPYNPYAQLPPQNQYPAVGYFGGEPEKPNGMPGWAWALIGAGIVIVILAIGGVFIFQNLKPPTPTQQAVVPTDAPIQRPVTTPARTIAQVIAATPTNKPIPTALPTPTILPVAVNFSINGSYTLANIESRKPKANFAYFVVDFSVQNNSTKPLLTGPTYFEIQSNQGYSYEYGDVTYLLPKGYKSTTLAPGESTRGEIAFEIPSNEIIKTGRYEDVFGNKITLNIN